MKLFTIGYYSKENQLNQQNEWLQQNYIELKKICQKVSKLNDVDDLLHSCIEQFTQNKVAKSISDKEKLFFFTKLVKNNFYSKTSQYYNEYGRFKFSQFADQNKPDGEYEESEINLLWVEKQIKEHKKGDLWYYARLFELFIEGGCSVSDLAKKTTIPINSVSRDINKYRRLLRKLRDQYYNGM